MSKILLINGSPNEHGCTYTALNEIAKTLNLSPDVLPALSVLRVVYAFLMIW